MKRSELVNELAGALSKAQGEFTAAERDHVAKVTSKKGEGSSYSYNYADLAAYLDVCRGPLANNGLSFLQEAMTDGSKVSVATLLLHASGQWIEFEPLSLHASDAMPQSVGSAITYARRYSLSAATGMASEADDDAQSAQGTGGTTAPRQSNLPACPRCGTNKSVIVGKEEYGGGFVCFAKKGGCGEKWQNSTKEADTPKTDTKKLRHEYEAAMNPEELAGFTEKIKSYTERITNAESLLALDEIATELKGEDKRVVGVISPLGRSRRNVLTNVGNQEQFA